MADETTTNRNHQLFDDDQTNYDDADQVENEDEDNEFDGALRPGFTRDANGVCRDEEGEEVEDGEACRTPDIPGCSCDNEDEEYCPYHGVKPQ